MSKSVYKELAESLLYFNCQGMLPFKNEQYSHSEDRPETKMLRRIAADELVVVEKEEACMTVGERVWWYTAEATVGGRILAEAEYEYAIVTLAGEVVWVTKEAIHVV